ncbi:protein sidekick [Holotrichia oblita]|uniref:Protein sidekick n=1 Tax=Holotrichia oblita TaxID=644536 RepID=A0ACB9T819_HOLOL|nr:protein sidekick [Holotrichia oblita]
MLALTVATIFTFLYPGEAQVTILQSPSSVVLAEDYETSLSCKMDTNPDRFQWRHYPVTLKQAYSSTYHLVLAEAHYENVPAHRYRSDNSSTWLTIANTNVSVAGFYQCLAHYGAQVIASIPGRISIPILEEFPEQKNISITVTEGNTIQWRCPEPVSNPVPTMNYFNSKRKLISPEYSQSSLLLPNVTLEHKDTYSCTAYNQYKVMHSHSFLNLNVIKRKGARGEKPKFIMQPKQHYVSLKDSNVFLECTAVGEPIPTVRWFKRNGDLPKRRTKEEIGGLYITNVRHSDQGVYVCEYHNHLGSVSIDIQLEYNERPRVIRGPFNRDNTTVIIEEGQDIELECEISGIPTPIVSWFLNGKTIRNDSNTRVEGNILRFEMMEKSHAGMVQCFASNIVSTDCGNFLMPVFPKQISGVQEYPIVMPKHKKRKHSNKNSRGRAHVRWKAPTSENGLPIKFFKVQYRDISRENEPSSTWLTANTDIAPHITSFDVTSLKPDHTYRFRIAAVYSNDDNKPSPKSDAFHLKRLDFETRNPLPIPIITKTETLNATSIRVYWEYTPVTNITINGFFVNYMPATISGDYTKATVDGQHIRSYIISHLDPNTIYEIRMQTFDTKHASDLSQKMHTKTSALAIETTVAPLAKKSEQEHAPTVNIYVIIAGGVIGVALLIIVIIVVIVGRNWKKKKLANRNDRINDDDLLISGNNDKQPAEDLNHHIQVENNEYEYVMPSKTPRANGCVISSNHITIRSNPLADADNKVRSNYFPYGYLQNSSSDFFQNQNMIEMSCLSSQNNNCSTQPSASTQEIHHHTDKTATKNKKHKNGDNPGENYV